MCECDCGVTGDACNFKLLKGCEDARKENDSGNQVAATYLHNVTRHFLSPVQGTGNGGKVPLTTVKCMKLVWTGCYLHSLIVFWLMIRALGAYRKG